MFIQLLTFSLGGNYGTGHRAGGVSALVGAILDDRVTATSLDDDEEDLK